VLEVAKGSEQDPDLSRVLLYTYQGRPIEAESKLQLYFKHKLELSIEF
jgi:hypothetical protein